MLNSMIYIDNETTSLLPRKIYVEIVNYNHETKNEITIKEHIKDKTTESYQTYPYLITV